MRSDAKSRSYVDFTPAAVWVEGHLGTKRFLCMTCIKWVVKPAAAILGWHHRLGGWPQVWLAVNSRPDWCLVRDDRYSMSVRFSSAGVACVGRASFRVWPPPLRERPQWEGHLHNSRNGRSNYLRQHMCARDSRIPRLRRDNDGLAERIRIASFSLIRKLTTEERKM